MLLHRSEQVLLLFLVLELGGSQVTKSFFLLRRQLNMKRYFYQRITQLHFLLSLNTCYSPETFLGYLFQSLEVVRLEGHAYSPEDMGLARDMYLLQV